MVEIKADRVVEAADKAVAGAMQVVPVVPVVVFLLSVHCKA
jgi:hypothetical protein